VLGILWVSASSNRDGDDEDDDGRLIETTSPNCAVDVEDDFRRIGATSPNSAPIEEAVAFDTALVKDVDSSLAFSDLSTSSKEECNRKNSR